MHIHPRAERRLLALILALFVLLGFSYALITPAFEAVSYTHLHGSPGGVALLLGRLEHG